MNIIEKYSINIVNKHRPTGSQVDINKYNEGTAKSLLRIFNKYYESLSYMFSLMKKAHLENTQTYLDMKDKLNKLSIDD